jgi:type III restriction enzyme
MQGQNILEKLREAQQSVGANAADQLPRIAFKMATGSGKTVVMACLICYHYFNRQEYRNDERFADYFLIIAPGVTIKDRLGVLKVDTNHDATRKEKEDYYHIRALAPSAMEQRLQGLNARLVITNYHAFEPKILQGNKRSPFDGKVNLKGEKMETGNKENTTQVIKRVLSGFKQGGRLLVLNDEAHHCYLPKSTAKTTDNEEADENKKAAVWFSGLRAIAQKFKLQNVYDLSATPYYLQGSGYEAYSLFPWVVSDFGLIEAIESGLVKIPFLPERDNTQVLEQQGNQVIPAPVLRDLYRNVIEQDPNALPRKGQKTIKSEQKKSAQKAEEKSEETNEESEQDQTKTKSNKKVPSGEAPPKLPALVQGALDQFYKDYEDYDKGARSKQETRADLFTAPPVFIVVCNNTTVSKELYKLIAGYELLDQSGERKVVTGRCELFSNYDKTKNTLLERPPTLLIDSESLENGNQINDDFKKIFATEINLFKRDYIRLKGQGSAENITDAEILRELVNTVGQKGKLGAHIRCVVSVSMLTEGWDANTVTHIMGLRAFGSQLLCEQVAGRGLCVA